jgi:putative spermidine/putrescine transport system substrate-binding protein
VSLTRHELLRRGLGAVAAASLGGLAGCGERVVPTGGISVEAPAFDGVVRVLGTPEVLAPVMNAARLSFPYRVAVELADDAELLERVAGDPSAFDVVSAGVDQVERLWASGNLVGLDRARILLWSQVSALYVLGRFEPSFTSCRSGRGDAPYLRMWSSAVHEPGALVRSVAGETPPPALAGAPSTFGLDAFAYDGTVVDALPYQVSWGELFNRRWRGRVALCADPVAGFQSAALAAGALGAVRVANAARPTIGEVDALARVVERLQDGGQFRAFWSTLDESADLLAGKDVALEPLSWPAWVLLRASGHPVRYADPLEGSRGWAELLLFSRAAVADPARLQACYDVVNWWHAGGPGATHMRLGWYNAVEAASLLDRFVSQDEWDYWIRGLPAAIPLSTVYGEDTVPQGAVRDGGSLSHRACSVAVWRSDFGDAAEHAAARWQELASA